MATSEVWCAHCGVALQISLATCSVNGGVEYEIDADTVRYFVGSRDAGARVVTDYGRGDTVHDCGAQAEPLVWIERADHKHVLGETRRVDDMPVPFHHLHSESRLLQGILSTIDRIR